jgi:hypothetical protein
MRRTNILLVIVLISLLVGKTISETKQTNKTTNPSNAKQGKPQVNLVDSNHAKRIKLINPSINEQNANNTEENKNDVHERIALWIAGAAFLVSVLSVFYTRKQARIAKETAEKQLRAYIGVKPLDYYRHHAITGKSTFIYTVVNYGQTPAKDVKIIGKLKMLDYPMSEDTIPDYFPEKITPQTSNVFPREEGNNFTGTIVSDSIIPDNILDQIESIDSIKKLYAFISITYIDIFNMERHTSFCACMFKTTRQNGEPAAKWAITDRFNDFD